MSTDIAVVGAGTMGAGIAQVAISSGLTTTLYDPYADALERAVARIERALQRRVSRGAISDSQASAALEHLDPSPATDALRDAAFVIEAAPEDLAVKHAVFRMLSDVCNASAILATNTSSLSVTRVAAAALHPERVAGMHFFNPAPAQELVEVIGGHLTAAPAIVGVEEMARRLGKTPIRVADTPGFVVNRVARHFYGEALRIHAEGVDVAMVDHIMREAGGFKMGPFELMDLIGIDVNLAVTKSVFDAFFGDARYRPHPIQQRMVDAGTLGRKTGRGFYSYDDEG